MIPTDGQPNRHPRHDLVSRTTAPTCTTPRLWHAHVLALAAGLFLLPPAAGCDHGFPPLEHMDSGHLCGNGLLDPGETCDDGNQDNTDDCPGAA